MRATFPAHLNPFDVITLIIFGMKRKRTSFKSDQYPMYNGLLYRTQVPFITNFFYTGNEISL